ncbi:MAG: universal stress protein [Sphingobacteriaceae bacterium]|nr:universal stress protein [Sphingobacteriaceae bacterium]
MAQKSASLKKILVPTDFSEKADRALEIACELARVTRCSLTILHVIELPYSTELRKAKLKQELEKSAKPALKETVKKAKSLLSRLKIDIKEQMVVGNPVHGIVQEASAGGYDLICMGNRITTGLRRLVFDNTTSGVIDLANCPVLATTSKHPSIQLSSMLFGTDYREGDLSILSKVCALANDLKSTLSVVHISKKKGFEEKLRAAGFEALAREKVVYKDIRFQQFYNSDVDSGIESAIKAINAGLIILSREHRGILDTLFGSDVIDDLVYKVEVPVLVYPIQST